jgi:hypothetical protein
MYQLRKAAKMLVVAGTLLAAGAASAGDVTSDRAQASQKERKPDISKGGVTDKTEGPGPDQETARPCICHQAAPKAKSGPSLRGNSRDAEVEFPQAQGG